jgi:cell division protein FtsW (lipid II flippase)
MRQARLSELFTALYAREGRRGPSVRRRVWLPSALPQRIILFVLMLGVGWWWQSAAAALMTGNAVTMLKTFSVLLTPANSKVEIGRRDLGQRPGAASAEEKHIELALEPSTGAVSVRNIAQTKKLWLRYRGHENWIRILGLLRLRTDSPFETFAERIPIPAGEVSRLYFTGGSAVFRNVTATSFDLDIPEGARRARSFHYDATRGPGGIAFAHGGTWDSACAEPGTVSKLRRAASDLGRAWWGRVLAFLGAETGPSEEDDIAALGGEHDCAEDGRKQIGGMGALHWRELKIVRRGSLFMVAPFTSSERYLRPVALAIVDPTSLTPVDTRHLGFADVAWPIDETSPWGELSSLTVGFSQYGLILCRDADSGSKPGCSDRTPQGAVRVVFTPTRKIPVFDPAECAQEPGRHECPTPLNSGSMLSGCTEARAKCWQWSEPRNLLQQEAAFSSVLQRGALSQWERLLRIAVIALALLVVAGLSGGWRRLWRHPASWRSGAAPGPSPMPVVLTCVSAALSLGPEIAHFAGWHLSAAGAIDLMLYNWGLAGLVLLAGASGVPLGLFWLTLMLLAAIGSTTLGTMAIDGDTTGWAQYFVRQKYLFLDLVPPVIIAVASCPPRGLRPFLQEMIVGLRPRYRLLLWLPSLMLVLSFFLWLVSGGQTGLGSFQPVEAGKFAAVLLLATALMRLDPDVQRTAVSRNLPSRLLSLVVLAVFFVVLMVVPVFRSDWSPVLIIAILTSGLLGAFFLPMCWRVVSGALSRRAARFRVPVAFRPKLRWRWLRAANFAFLILIAVVATTPFAVPIMRVGATWLLSLKEWPDDTDRRLQALEVESLGKGRRVVAERFIAWSDLNYSNPPKLDCGTGGEPTPARKGGGGYAPLACYRDIEWQVIRARRVVAHAPCGIVGPLDFGGAAVFGNPVAFSPGTSTETLQSTRPVCGLSAAAPSSTPSDTDVIPPIRIPVVESDFAGAYLIGRFGLGAANLLYAAQVILLGIIIYGFVCLLATRSGNRMDAGIRRFIAVLVAGAGLLFFLQWLLSWSNILGLLPVMGQPMTLLSYAVSHHLFMVLPCLLVVVVALRYTSAERPVLVPRGVPHRSRRALLR